MKLNPILSYVYFGLISDQRKPKRGYDECVTASRKVFLGTRIHLLCQGYPRVSSFTLIS